MQEEETTICATTHNVKAYSKVEGEEMNQEMKIILNCFGTFWGRIWSVGWQDSQGNWHERKFSTSNSAHKFVEELRRC